MNRRHHRSVTNHQIWLPETVLTRFRFWLRLISFMGLLLKFEILFKIWFCCDMMEKIWSCLRFDFCCVEIWFRLWICSLDSGFFLPFSLQLNVVLIGFNGDGKMVKMVKHMLCYCRRRIRRKGWRRRREENNADSLIF